MRILIVEDDQKLARQLQKGLAEQGYTATLAFEGHEGLHTARSEPFDVFVLDVMLPGIDGFSLVRRLRTSGSVTPILLLTARDTAEDIVMGLDAGADDYLTKPFSFKVLVARLRALSRRKQVEPRTHLHIADLVLDSPRHEVKRAGVPIPLTPREFELLELLLRNSGRVLTRSRLIEAVWGSERDVESNTLDVFISQLRTKLEAAGMSKLIHTIRGIGYTLREEETV
jgi:two-component system copper resistance phosphate regulon response regulator CusR